MNIDIVHVCVGSCMPLEEEEEVAIVKDAITSSRKHSNVFEQVFKYVFDNHILIERISAVLPTTSDEDLPKRTRELFMENRPEFDYTQKVNYLMHFKFWKEGQEHTAAVFFLFE